MAGMGVADGEATAGTDGMEGSSMQPSSCEGRSAWSILDAGLAIFLVAEMDRMFGNACCY